MISWPGRTRAPTGSDVSITRCCNNYGPVPVLGEGDPAVRHQPARRAEGPAVRRRAERARLGARRRPLPGGSSWSLEHGQPGAVYHVNGDVELANTELTQAILDCGARQAEWLLDQLIVESITIERPNDPVNDGTIPVRSFRLA